MNDELKREDYEEPRCVLCDPQTGRRYESRALPMQRIVEKLDDYCDRRDYAGAERHLKYWLEEALFNGDLRGAFSMRNEMMGFYRKQGNREAAFENAEAALGLMKELQIEDSAGGGTCLVNCGTVCDQFGMPEKALEYFERAQAVYEALPHPNSAKLGGLYNNMGLAHMDAGHFEEARSCFEKALTAMSRVIGGEPEAAITYLNMADCAALERGIDGAQQEIDGYVKRAMELLDTPGLNRNGYYGFVCGRCAPGFYCYGYPEYGAELEERAEKICQEAENEGT